MIITDPVQQSRLIDSTQPRVPDNTKDKPVRMISEAPEIKGMHRKSIFADHAGVLIAQVKDHTGEVITTCPSPEVIKRYHERLKEES